MKNDEFLQYVLRSEHIIFIAPAPNILQPDNIK